MGTPDLAAAVLRRLVRWPGGDVVAVYTQPDRPAGRGHKLTPSPVKKLAQELGLPVHQPLNFRQEGAVDELAALKPDLLVVAAYGLILPQWVLDLPRLGCLNIHASLLPRWRGAAPIHRAIEAGDAETGVTIMQMDAGLDTGDMLLAERVPIGARATTARLHDELAALGGRLIVPALHQAGAGTLAPVPQPAEGVSYAHKIDKHEAAIDWAQPAEVIERRVRAFDPFPGASTQAGDALIKIWRSEIDSTLRLSNQRPGQILSVNEAGVTVACGAAALRLTELQRPGGKRLPAREFLAGFALAPGQVLGGTGASAA